MAVLSDWELQGRAAPSRAAWRSFPQLAGSLLGRDNLPSPSVCHEVSCSAHLDAHALRIAAPETSLPSQLCSDARSNTSAEPFCLQGLSHEHVLQVFSFSTASLADPEAARMALKRHLGDLATLRGRSLAGPLPALPLGSQDNSTVSEASCSCATQPNCPVSIQHGPAQCPASLIVACALSWST